MPRAALIVRRITPVPVDPKSCSGSRLLDRAAIVIVADAKPLLLTEWLSFCIVGYSEVCAEQRVGQEGSSPSSAQMRGAISKKRGSQPRWPEKAERMETSKRARR